MDFLAKARRVFEIELDEVRRVGERLDESFTRAVETILASLKERGKIVVIGVGKSGHIGEKIAATMTSTGSPAVVLNSLNALHGDLGVVADGDVILALSFSGETEELLRILPALSRFEVKIVSITGNPKSTLAIHSDVHLDASIQEEACPLGLAPTSSTTATLVLGDALAMVLLEARNFKKEDFARYHPGGSLGRSLLLKVTEIMRTGDQLALMPPETPIHEVIKRMANARAGAAVLVHPDGTLAGVFTHGDFGRQFEKVPDLLNRQVGEFMTPCPITVNANKMAVEVLRIMQKHAVDDLIVVDQSSGSPVPVGLVDSQDLAKFRLV